MRENRNETKVEFGFKILGYCRAKPNHVPFKSLKLFSGRTVEELRIWG